MLLFAALLLGCPAFDGLPTGRAVAPAAKTTDPKAETKPAPAVRPRLVPVSPPVTGLHLRGLRSSSGSDLPNLLDGNPATGWTPEGDPVDESVTLRFEQPVDADQLELTACGESPTTWWNVIVNGAEAGRVDTSPGVPGVLHLGPGTSHTRLASLQLRVADGRRGACLADLVLSDAGAPLPLRPPRSVSATLRVTSVHIPYAAHHPWYLVDGRPDFSWTEGKDGNGVGESFTLAVEDPIALVGIEVWNGDQRSPEAFAASGRAARVGISVDKGGYVSFPVRDVMGPQRLELPRVTVGRLVTMAMLAVVRGGSYDDLDISEVRLWDPMGPLAVITPDPSDRRAQLKMEIAGTGFDNVVDRRLDQVCPSGGERRLKLRSNLSFSYLGPGAGQPGVAREVFEGDWARRDTKGGWVHLELSGRRHPVLMSWVGPEADREDLSVVQLAELARVQDLGAPAFATLLKEWEHGPQRGAVDCLAAAASDAGVGVFDYLVSREAIVVRGQAFTDLLGPGS